jgi:hypothetical protein
MPTAKDVRDILDIPNATPSEPQSTSPNPGFTLKLPPNRAVSFLRPADPPAPSASPAPKPVVSSSIASNLNEAQRYRRAKNKDGIVRELYALIGDNAPSLVQMRTEPAAGVASGPGSGSGKYKRWPKADSDVKWYAPIFEFHCRPNLVPSGNARPSHPRIVHPVHHFPYPTGARYSQIQQSRSHKMTLRHSAHREAEI